MADLSEEQSNSSPKDGVYEIQVQGQLNSSWSDWLEGLNIELLENGEMILYGRINDQAALMGVLNKLSRLNLALRSINPIDQNKDRRKNERKTES